MKYVTTASTQISAAEGKRYYAKVVAYRKSASGYEAEASAKTSSTLYGLPAKPVKLSVDWEPMRVQKYKNSIDIGWSSDSNYYYPDGYQIQIYSVNGKKKLKMAEVTSSSYAINTSGLKKAINNKGFKYKVRSYKTVNGVKIYGNWTSFKTVVPTAKISKVTANSKTSATIKWAKVANTKYYYVYYCKKNPSSSTAKWKRVKVSAKKTSYKLTGVSKGSRFGVYVVPVVKIGKKSYKATASEYYAAYIY